MQFIDQIRKLSFLLSKRSLLGLTFRMNKAYGIFESIAKKAPVNADSKPIPWFTYSANEFLNSLDLSAERVFEYGSGNSTLYWSSRCQKVLAIENDHMFSKMITSRITTENAKVRFLSKSNAYIDSGIVEFNPTIIVIDGAYRYKCTKHVLSLLPKLNNLKILVFDNSDGYPNAIELIQNQRELFEIKFSGFGPINNYSWVTSIIVNLTNIKLLNRNSKFQPQGGLDTPDNSDDK